jgi:hypothetical protein
MMAMTQSNSTNVRAFIRFSDDLMEQPDYNTKEGVFSTRNSVVRCGKPGVRGGQG